MRGIEQQLRPGRTRWSTEQRIGAFVGIAAVGIRIWLSATLYLNPDEALHLNAASSRQWTAVYHPPLLLWWLWLASQVSEKEWWLRLLPSVAGGLAPVAAAVWLRRFVSPITAWGLAALLGFAPILVYLTIQLRGYSLAMLAVLLALIALDRAFAESSEMVLAAHYAALYVAILAEFSVAWIALAIGLYGLAHLVRAPHSRRFLSAWIAGQTVAVLIYAWLYLYLVKPLLGIQNSALISFLDPFLFQHGQNPATFAFRGFISQFTYITGGEIQGWFAAGLFVIGIVSWIRSRDSRATLAVVPYAVAIAGFVGLFPFGRSRHTVVIGLVSLAGVGAGIEVVARRVPIFKFCAPLILLALLFTVSSPDFMNISLERWQKKGWDKSLAQLRFVVPPGSIIVTRSAVMDMLVAYRSPRHRRNLTLMYSDNLESQSIDGFRFLVFGYFYKELGDPALQAKLWKNIEELRQNYPGTPRAVWFLNGGWESGHFPAGLSVINGPEIYLSRLDQ